MKKVVLFAAAALLLWSGAQAQTLSITALEASPMTNGKVHFILAYVTPCGASINMALKQGADVKDGIYLNGVTGGGTIDTTFTPPAAGAYSVECWAFDGCDTTFATTVTMYVTTSSNATAVQQIAIGEKNPIGSCKIISLTGATLAEYPNINFNDVQKQFAQAGMNGIYILNFISSDGQYVYHEKISVR